MDRIEAYIGGISTIVVFVSFLLVELVKIKKQLADLRTKEFSVTFAVSGEIPDILASFPIYSNYRKFLRDPSKVKVLLVRNISFGLRHCDFVITDHDDVKLIDSKNKPRIEAILDTRGRTNE